MTNPFTRIKSDKRTDLEKEFDSAVASLRYYRDKVIEYNEAVETAEEFRPFVECENPLVDNQKAYNEALVKCKHLKPMIAAYDKELDTVSRLSDMLPKKDAAERNKIIVASIAAVTQLTTVFGILKEEQLKVFGTRAWSYAKSLVIR